MKMKIDKNAQERNRAIRHAMKQEFMTHPWRSCLRLAQRFLVGWAAVQVLAWTLFGGFLMWELMINPAGWAAEVHTVSQINHLSEMLTHEAIIFATGPGVLMGLFWMVVPTLCRGGKPAKQNPLLQGAIHNRTIIQHTVGNGKNN